MTMTLTPENLQQLALHSAKETKTCSCIRGLSRGWESLPAALATGTLLRLIGHVTDDHQDEQTLDEYHPHGTHFWSEEAPICFEFFPYNIASVWGCTQCSRAFLRFNDAGAYHSEPRIRLLDAALIKPDPRRDAGFIDAHR